MSSPRNRLCEKRARAENAQNCFLSFLLSTVTARAVLFLFNVIETNFLRASSTSEFSHGLGQKRRFEPASHFRSTPSNGHRQNGATGPVRANSRHCMLRVSRVTIGVCKAASDNQ